MGDWYPGACDSQAQGLTCYLPQLCPLGSLYLCLSSPLDKASWLLNQQFILIFLPVLILIMLDFFTDIEMWMLPASVTSECCVGNAFGKCQVFRLSVRAALLSKCYLDEWQ